MIFAAMLFTLWFSVWLLLSWPPDLKDVISGIFVSLFVTFMTIDVMGRGDREEKRARGIKRQISRVGWFGYYVLVFVWECLKANIDVAYRVIHPDLPIRPGTIKVKVGLTSDIGLTFLASSVTLTPGTTTVDVDKKTGYLYVHMLYVEPDQPELKVVIKFEKILKRIFE